MAAGARTRPSGDRCGVPDPELLRDDGAARRTARHRSRAATPFAEGHPHAMKGAGPYAAAADTVFDGATLHRDHAVVVEGGRISALVPINELPDTLPIRRLSD